MSIIFSGHTGPVTCVAFSSDGLFILSGSTDHTVRLWRVADAVELACIQGHKDGVLAVAFSNAGPIVSGGKDKAIRAWSADLNGQGKEFPLVIEETGNHSLHAAETTMVVFSSDGTQAMTAGHDQWTEQKISNIERAIARNRGKELGESKKVSDLTRTSIRPWHLSGKFEEALTALHDDDEKVHVLAFTNNGRVALFSTKSSEQKFALHVYDIDQMYDAQPFLDVNSRQIIGAFSSNGRRLLLSCESDDPCGTDLRTLRLWNVLTGKVFPHQFNGHTGDVNCIAFSPRPDKFHALSGSDDKTVRHWDVTTGNQLECFEGHTDQVNCVAFSADGRLAASGSSDGTVRSWILPQAI